VSTADRADRGEGNDHATVKSTALMSWLVKLVTRPGETILDPFAGSGSTGVAALRCERRFVGVERDPHYHAIALKRLAAVDGPLFARPAGEAAP
jgi:DNA modification methylase